MDLLRLFELAPLPVGGTRPRSSYAFDAIYALLGLLFTAGFYWDIWSHSTYGPDQNVFSEYHLLFYSAIATLGLWLIFTVGRNLRAGRPRYAALPRGYGLPFLGILVFGFAGTLDLIGHALYGFEVGLEALLSPTHVPLFLSWFVLASGPLRAALKASEDGEALDLVALLPALASLACAMLAMFTTTLAFSPLGGGGPWMLHDLRTEDEFFGEALGVMGIFIQTLILVGPTLWFASRLKLPSGALSVLYALLGLGKMILGVQNAVWLPLFLVVGLTLDLLLHVLEPWRGAMRFRLLGFLSPLVLWGFFFAYVILFLGGIWYRPYIWLGVFVETMALGFLIAHLIVSRPPLAPAMSDSVSSGVEVKAQARAYAGSGD